MQIIPLLIYYLWMVDDTHNQYFFTQNLHVLSWGSQKQAGKVVPNSVILSDALII